MTGEFLDKNGLVGYWKLDGNLNDSSTNSYTLTNNGSTDVVGLMGNGRSFVAASSQYASIADASCPSLEITGSQTWLCWLKQTTISSYQSPMAKTRLDNTATHGLTTSADANAFVYFTLTGLTTNAQISGGTGVAGKWHFLCGIYDSSAGRLKLFLDGGKIAELAASGSATDTNGDFALGRNGSSNSQFFNGVIDNCAIYSRAWSDNEVKKYYAWAKGHYAKAI